MAAITVKNIPTKLYTKLKKSAKEHHRSINSEIIYFLENSLTSSRIDPNDFLVKLDILHNQFILPSLSDKQIRDAIKEGRA